MKNNAIIRIILLSLAFLILLGILLTGIGIGLFAARIEEGTFNVSTNTELTSNTVTSTQRDLSKLRIQWAVGDITIQRGDVSTIQLTESGDLSNDRYQMACAASGDQLTVSYNAPGIHIGIGSLPVKDLTVTVPMDWVCQELEIDAASADIRLEGLTIGELEIDGAANTLSFSGSFQSFNCDGASNQITAILTDTPREVDLDGASVDMTLTLPQNTGFRVDMEGLSCKFSSDFDTAYSRNTHTYGDGRCQIDVDGMSCRVSILKAEE